MPDQQSNPAAATENTPVLTRRQLITSVAAGGAALVVAGAGGAAVGRAVTAAEYELELTKLRALLALYDRLERVGLDAIIAAGVNIVQGAIDTVKGGIGLLRQGITAAETALTNLQSTIDSLRPALDSAGKVLADLQSKVDAAQGVVIAVLGTALPLADSISGFFQALLSKIPFGIGDDIRRAVSALVDLIRAVPAAVDSLTSQLLKTLADDFFPSTGDPKYKSGLIELVTDQVLTPLTKTLDDLQALANHWENDLTAPVNAALVERQKIRDQIADYKKNNGLT
ncbi:MAG: hypothetical protein M1482_02115 [Chloroflexi bacterium]|nr:hypothetical protein [Chloroflexota bacterium]